MIDPTSLLEYARQDVAERQMLWADSEVAVVKQNLSRPYPPSSHIGSGDYPAMRTGELMEGIETWTDIETLSVTTTINSSRASRPYVPSWLEDHDLPVLSVSYENAKEEFIDRMVSGGGGL